MEDPLMDHTNFKCPGADIFSDFSCEILDFNLPWLTYFYYFLIFINSKFKRFANLPIQNFPFILLTHGIQKRRLSFEFKIKVLNCH